MHPRFTGLAISLILIIGAFTALTAASEYQITSADAVEVPERTVEIQDSDHSFDSMIQADPGDQITVDVSAPDEVYRTHIRNNDAQIEASKRGNGSETFTFDLTGYEPGSYAVAPYENGEYRAVLPLLVEGYDVTVKDAPASVESSETFVMTMDVTQTDSSVDSEPAKVQAVVADDSETHTVEASKSSGEYVASVDASELDDGEYTLWGVAQGEEEAFDRKDVLGRSAGQSLIIETSTPTPTQEGSGGGGGGGAASPGEENGSEGDTAENSTELAFEPDTVANVTVADADSDRAGVTVEVPASESESVRRVTFDSVDVEGTVQIGEYETPPADAVDGVTDHLSVGNGGDEGDESSSSGVSVVKVVDISPDSESARQSSATVELEVPRDAFSDPQRAVIVHERPDGTWDRLDTSVQEIDSGLVSLSGDVESFSLFAVAETNESALTPTPTPTETEPTIDSTPSPTPGNTATPSPTTTAPTATPTPESVITPQSTATPTDTPGNSGPGFTVVGALLAILGSLALIGRR